MEDDWFNETDIYNVYFKMENGEWKKLRGLDFMQNYKHLTSLTFSNKTEDDKSIINACFHIPKKPLIYDQKLDGKRKIINASELGFSDYNQEIFDAFVEKVWENLKAGLYDNDLKD